MVFLFMYRILLKICTPYMDIVTHLVQRVLEFTTQLVDGNISIDWKSIIFVKHVIK